jgi:hypothetical protein
MSIIQALLGSIVSSSSGGGGGSPTAYAGYGSSGEEGLSTTVTVTVENWTGARVYWTVVGGDNPAADPATDMTGTLSGIWDPGATSFAQTVVTTIGFVADDGTEGTEYWGINLGSTEGGSDYYSSSSWPISEPLDYTPWTIEWWHKSNPTQPSQFPRLFALGSFPHEIGFSMESIFYGWIAGNAIGTGLGRVHNTWQHWAIVSNGTTISIYKDGVFAIGSNRSNAGLIDNITDNLFIGSESGGSNGFKGLITNFRVVKGQAMYDPTQSTITVPTIPLWSNSNTELLLRAVDSGSLTTDSSSRNRISVGTGSNAFSSDTPFTTPTPAGPVIITQGQSWNPELTTLYIDRATFPSIDDVQPGWTFVSANYTATVVSAVTAFDLRNIVLSINSGAMDGSIGTFTQYQVGGSIELFTGNAGYIAFDNGREWAFDLPASTYALNVAGGTAVDEGSAQTFVVSGSDIPDGTYYWTVETNAGDFATTNGTVSVSGGTGLNLGSFIVTPTADTTTEGQETFTVALRSNSITGTKLATSPTVIINDTSLTPKLELTSGTALGFNGSDNLHVVVADNLADWNLGDNWTIEWWHKIPTNASGFMAVLCQDANVPTYSGIDVYVNAGTINMFNGGLQVSETPATRDEWNHIAIQNYGTTLTAYINGVERTVTGSHPGTISPSSPLNVVIGSRTADGGVNFYGQYFNGLLANIRISSIARYTGTFTPPTTVEYDSNTKLALDGSVGSGGMLVDELTRHTLTNNGASIVTID